MIVSDNPRRSNSRRLQIYVLLCALVVLPLGIASAQDYEAIERRLGEAVAKGELSLEQARIMMDALLKADGAKKQAAKGKSDTDLESARRKLQAMVKAGEITQEQATAKMLATKKEAVKKDKGSDRAEAYLMKVKKELGDAVEAGKISKEEAAKRFAAAEKGIKERMVPGSTKSGSKRLTREQYELAEAKLKKAVAEGKISKEDMSARLDEMRKMMGQKSDSAVKKGPTKKISPEDLAKAKAKIRNAIAEGKITEKQGQAKLAAMEKMMVKQSDGANSQGTDRETSKKRIEGAVKSGNMTREEADAKYKELREKLSREVKKEGAKDKRGQ